MCPFKRVYVCLSVLHGDLGLCAVILDGLCAVILCFDGPGVLSPVGRHLPGVWTASHLPPRPCARAASAARATPAPAVLAHVNYYTERVNYFTKRRNWYTKPVNYYTQRVTLYTKCVTYSTKCEARGLPLVLLLGHVREPRVPREKHPLLFTNENYYTAVTTQISSCVVIYAFA